MADCPFYADCPLANELLLADDIELVKEYLNTPGVLTIDGLSESYKEKYCNNYYTECARYQVVEELGFEYLPNNLLPHQENRAELILADNS